MRKQTLEDLVTAGVLITSPLVYISADIFFDGVYETIGCSLALLEPILYSAYLIKDFTKRYILKREETRLIGEYK